MFFQGEEDGKALTRAAEPSGKEGGRARFFPLPILGGALREEGGSRCRPLGGDRDDVPTLERTCPRGGPRGRSLRSKIRWFAAPRNSHHVSQFAAFFIDAGAEISIAEGGRSVKNVALSDSLSRPYPFPSRGKREGFEKP